MKEPLLHTQRQTTPREKLLALWPLGLCLLLAVLATWPLARAPSSIHADRFALGNLIIFERLWDYLGGAEGAPNHVRSVNFPLGFHVSMTGWPLWLLTLPLRLFTGPVAAFNLASLLMLALGGWLTFLALRRAGLADHGAILAGASFTVHPLFLGFLVNGQVDQSIGLAFPLVFWGSVLGGGRGALLVGLALVLAGFSNPYQIVPVGLLAGSLLFMKRTSYAAFPLLGALVGAILPVVYFARPPASGLPQHVPLPSYDVLPALLGDLFVPQALRGVDPALASVDAPEVSHVVYLGVSLLALASLGLVRARREPLVRLIALSGALSLLLALGSHPCWSSPERCLDSVSLPWAWLAHLPYFGRLGMSFRYSTGAAFALCVLAGWGLASLPLPSRWRRPATLGVVALCVADALLLGPVHLPLRCREPGIESLYASIPARGLVVFDLPAYTNIQPTPRYWPAEVAFLHGHQAVSANVTQGNSLMEHSIVSWFNGHIPSNHPDLPIRLAGPAGQHPERLDAATLSDFLLHLSKGGVNFLAVARGWLFLPEERLFIAMLRQSLGEPAINDPRLVGFHLKTSNEP